MIILKFLKKPGLKLGASSGLVFGTDKTWVLFKAWDGALTFFMECDHLLTIDDTVCFRLTV